MKSRAKILLVLCWVVYFSTYLGRINYSATLAEMISAEGFSKAQTGIIGTGFFLSYGIGQFISGFLGDKLSPKWLVFTGMFTSGLINLVMGMLHSPLQMAAIWCLNGLAQSLIWSPMLRLVCEWIDEKERMKACISLNTSVPLGTMAAYGMSGLLVGLGTWRNAYYLPGFFLIGIAVLWFVCISKIEPKQVTGENTNVVRKIVQKQELPEFQWGKTLLASGLVFLIFVLMVQGTLKDGVTTWIPTYISETYQIGSAAAITSTMLIPAFNLLGVTLASVVNQKLCKDEIRTSAFFFGMAAIAFLILVACSGKSIVISFLALAAATTSMMAVNTMLIAIVPTYFGRFGKASSVSGVLNSTVYLGGAASTYGIGGLSTLIGWKSTIWIWFWIAAAALVVCLLTVSRWRKFKYSLYRSL